MQFGVPERIVPEKHHAFAALLELQQAQKIKKTACWNSSKRKKSKNGPAGTPASQKNQKDGLLELQQAQKIKKTVCWNSSKPSRMESVAAL